MPVLLGVVYMYMELEKDWLEWHSPYADYNSPLSRRLRVVKRLLHHALTGSHSIEPKIVSICAGQGADVIEVLAELPESVLPEARLIELDPRNVQAARRKAEQLGVADRVDVRQGDAASLEMYDGIAPADVVLACGVFGNISDEDVYSTIDSLPQLCKHEAKLIWTRSRREPDFTPSIRSYLLDGGFVELEFVAPEDVEFSVGYNRFEGDPKAIDPTGHMFEFIA